MKPPAAPDPALVDVKRLDHLPLIGAMLRELAVKDTLDVLLQPHERNEVTVGECVEALVLTILTGEHALSRVADTLAGYDLAVIFQRPMEAAHVHDNRLGRALDALWTAGLDRLYGAVVSQAIHRYGLDLARLHTDTTSLKVYGVYEREADEEGPVVTFGYSRDHRPDLKQLLFGLTVTAEGVPVGGMSPTATVVTAPSSASTSRSCASICLTWANRSWWPTASSLRARPWPWRRRIGSASSPWCRRPRACDRRWSRLQSPGHCPCCGNGQVAAKAQ